MPGVMYIPGVNEPYPQTVQAVQPVQAVQADPAFGIPAPIDVTVTKPEAAASVMIVEPNATLVVTKHTPTDIGDSYWIICIFIFVLVVGFLAWYLTSVPAGYRMRVVQA